MLPELVQNITNYCPKICDQLHLCQLNKDIYDYVYVLSLWDDSDVAKITDTENCTIYDRSS